jgi:hypothetical protein
MFVISVIPDKSFFLIKRAGNHFGSVLLKLDHELREHTVNLAAPFTVTLTPWNPVPGGIPALRTGDPRTMIPVLKVALFAAWANEFHALR